MSENNIVTKALTAVSFEDSLPIKWFKRYLKKYGKPIKDGEMYVKGIYPTFDDFDYRHATSTTLPVYLNDFDFNLEEDRERLIKLIRMDFDTDSFSSISRCQCGKLKGNYLEGSGRICESCQTTVESLIDSELSTKVWLRLPEGVDKFINPAIFRTYLQKIATASPRVEIITFMIDSSYRRSTINILRKDRKGSRVLEGLRELEVELSINGFYRKVDEILHYFLMGKGSVLTKLKSSEAEMIYKHLLHFKPIMFCDYLPVPNKLSVIVERNGKDKYAASHQLKANSVYESIADTRSSDQFYKLTEEDKKDAVDKVGKAIPKLAMLRNYEMKEFAFQKQGIMKKHASSGALQFTGRSVITSQTGIIDQDVIIIPWIMALAQLHPFILSHLYRLGFSPTKAEELITVAAHKVVPEIEEFFTKCENNRDYVIKTGRMPSIKFLSRRTFFAKVNRDLSDESIRLPILSVKPFNADFDGEKIAVLNFSNCWNLLKLI